MRNDYDKLTDVEREALLAKLDNPRLDVKCPNCGTPLVYDDCGTAWQSRCPVCDIKATCRGL